MQHWTDEERRAARKLGIPSVANATWWWRAQHVLNSPERDALQRFTEWLRRRYAPEIRRAAMHLV